MEKSFITLHSSKFQHKKQNVFSSSSRKRDHFYDSDEENENIYSSQPLLSSDRSQYPYSYKYRDLRSDQKQRYDHLHYHLPLHSSQREKILVTKDNEFNSSDYYATYSNDFYLSNGSQKQLRETIESTIYEKYSKVEKIIHSKLLKDPFERLRSASSNRNKSKIKQSIRYYYPTLYEGTSKEWYQHRALLLLSKYWHFWNLRDSLKAFTHWKSLVHTEQWIKRKFFDHWNIKTGLWKYNRMTGKRFVKLLYPIAKKLLRKSAILHWKRQIEKLKNFKLIRMLFRIWKLTIQSNKEWKKKNLFVALKKLQINKNAFQQRDASKITYLNEKYKKKLLRNYLTKWYLQRKRKEVLKKIVNNTLFKGILLKGFNKWKSILPPKITIDEQQPSGIKSPKFSPREPSSPSPKKTIRKAAVYQNATSNEYRQITTTKKKKTPKLNWKDMSALERIEYRLRYVKHMDKEFMKLEKLRNESFQQSLDNIASFHGGVAAAGGSPSSSPDRGKKSRYQQESDISFVNEQEVGRDSIKKKNILCRHSHDNCLECNYSYQISPFEF
jgi:hypothetical protein